MKTPLRYAVIATLFLGALLVTAQSTLAQAAVSAQRGAEFTPFTMTTLLAPDWGPTNNLGYTVGMDYTRFIRSIVQPSLEFRFTKANGTTVNERSYAGGLKLQTSIHGIHPYATVLMGHADIDFVHPIGTYYGDASMIYTLGGGADFNVTRQWSVRMDFTDQHWNLDPNSLTPTAFGLGVAYSIPFHVGRVL
jgi:hypothetical protein